ncbi:polysaccharide biosynthesis C-terminal domain-containing protein [Bacillus timonensis]|nr:polysaccharide biosynthesis C-terminal domain-containing protein [Bacillus timonensis]
MVGRHIFFYFFAMGIPSIINFGAIIIYTRMLIPEEYGKYALILVFVRLFGNILFQWLRMSLYRYFPSYQGPDRKYLMSTAFFLFVTMSAVTTSLYVIGIFLLFPAGLHLSIWILGLFLILSQEWFEINLGILRHKLLPKTFGVLSFSRAVLSLSIGSLLVLNGFGPQGIIIGVLVGTAIPSLFITFREWRGIHLTYVRWDLIKSLLVYGLPLSGTFALGFIIYGTDRLFIQFYLGESNVGLYAVSYDLVNQGLFVLLNIINAASYPIILREYESKGEEEAKKQMEKTFISLFFISIGSTLGIILLSTNISYVLLGKEYRETAALLLPIIAPAVLLNALKQYYTDIPFKLKKKSYKQLLPVFIGGISNILLNIWWIPIWGVYGAAFASLAAYIITFIISASYAYRLIKIPFPIREIGKTSIAGIFMWAFLFPLLHLKGFLPLVLQIFTGAGIYLIASIVFNIGGMRSAIRDRILKFQKKENLSHLSKSL